MLKQSSVKFLLHYPPFLGSKMILKSALFILFLSSISNSVHATDVSCSKSVIENEKFNRSLWARLKQSTKDTVIRLSAKRGHYITEDDPNGYVEAMREDQFKDLSDADNISRSIYNRRNAKLQETVTLTGSGRVTSYFKYFDDPKKETFKVVKELWDRKRWAKPTESWQKAINQAHSYVKHYNELNLELKQITAQAFEAIELADVLKKLLDNHSSKDFSFLELQNNPITYEKPVYYVNTKTEQIEKKYVQGQVFRYDTLVLDYKAAVEAYQSILGMKSNPLKLLSDRKFKKLPYDWSQLKSPSYLLLSPFYLSIGIVQKIKGSLDYTQDSAKWLISTFIRPSNGFYLRALEQAFERRRLEIILQTLKTRSISKNEVLNDIERELVYGIEVSLNDPSLMPPIDALRQQLDYEYKAERAILFGHKVDALVDANENSDLPIYNIPKDVKRVQSVQSRFLATAKKKIKEWAPTVLVTGVLIGTVTTNYEGMKARLLDNPEVSYYSTKASNVVWDMRKENLGLESIVFDFVKKAARTWVLENDAAPAAVKDGTQIYTDNFRRDEDNVFINDPKYQAEVREIINTLLKERESRGEAVAFQYAVDQTVTWGYPTRTLDILKSQLTEKYSDDAEIISDYFSYIQKDVDAYLKPKENIQKYIKHLSELQNSLSESAIKDLFYMTQYKLTEAIDYYAKVGDLRNPYGSIYSQFISAPEGLSFVKPGWNIRSKPEESYKSRITETKEAVLVKIVDQSNDKFYGVQFMTGDYSSSRVVFVSKDAFFFDLAEYLNSSN